MMRKNIKCLVFGKTSAGKSTFINALLTENVLPLICGSKLNSFVVIQASADDSNYIVVDGQRRRMDELENLNNFHSADHLEDGSTINIFYNKQKCQLLNENVVLIDTPGLDSDFEMDISIEEHCKDADLIILIVNARCGLTRTEFDIFIRCRDIFSKLNVIIVFNFWDMVSATPTADAVKYQQTEKAKMLLRDELNYSESEADANIYFISAKERANIVSNNISGNSGGSWDLRNETFVNLINNLKEKMAEKSLRNIDDKRMELEIDNLCEMNYIKLFETYSTLMNIDIDQDSQSMCCDDLQKTWKIALDCPSLIDVSWENIKNEFEILKPKIMRKTKKCLVFGKISAGKSTFINALLAENVLTESYGSTSNSFVVIQASPDDSNYIVVDGKRRGMDELKSLYNFWSSDRLEDGSTINLFYNKLKCQLLSEDVVLIDTPGLDSDFIFDKAMSKQCKDADLIILIVNAICGLTRTEFEFFNQFRDIFSKLNVMIVFNFWDVVSATPISDEVKYEQIEKAKRLIRAELNHNESEADANIYFISAKERASIFSNNIAGSLSGSWDLRNETFANLFNNLKKEMVEKSVNRRHTYLSVLLSSVSSTFRQCQNYLCQMIQKRKELIDELDDLANLNEKIKAEIASKFNEAYEELMHKEFKILKTIVKAEEEKQCLINKEDLMSNEFEKYFIDIIIKALEKLKKKIIEFVAHDDQNRSLLRSNIMNKLCFPFYLNINNVITLDINSVHDNLVEIRSRKKKKIITAIGVTTGVTAACLATGGGLLAVFALDVAAGVISAMVIAGAAAGAGVGLGASAGVINHVKKAFHDAWKENESKIKSIWNSLESMCFEKYLKFIVDLKSNIKENNSSIESKSDLVENNINQIREDLVNLKKYSQIV